MAEKAKKEKKFRLQSKDGKQVFETNDAIEANRWRAQGLRDVPKKAPDSGGSNQSGSGKKN